MGNNLKRFSDKSLSTQSRTYGHIQARTDTNTTRGDSTVAWVNTTAADKPHAFGVTALSAKQRFEFKSENVEATHLMKLRGEIEVSELNQIEMQDGRIFEIITVEDIQDRGIVKWITTKQRRA